MIEKTQIEIKETRKNIEAIMKMNEHIHTEIDKLKEELIYQTLEEQNTINNEIYRMEKEMETNNKEAKKYELDVQSYESKIERLEQRKRDLHF